MGSKEAGQQMPSLVIRAHHLRTFAQFLRSADFPSEFARETTGELAIIVRFSEGKPTNQLDTEYIEDVLGNTLEERERFEKAQRTALEMFAGMPNDFPVEIVSTKDVICNGCAVGFHCLEQYEGDYEDIALFANSLKPGQRKKMRATRDFPYKVTTTLGVVRRVLETPMWDPQPSTPQF